MRAIPHLGLFLTFLSVSLLAGCSLKFPSFDFWSDESSRLSPRIVEYGEPVPKGGGVYKVGSPYRIKGKLYVPREVDHYDETGTASWYGMLFHGRRTANGEIYDMDALTAAHPTLPIPSYARVTNLRNGRSLVVRVNDRGPYAHDRIIDLSAAVASLLRMHNAGTAPVRVQYLGRAPMNGDDRYERRILARQPWAGPKVAFAKHPGKAINRRHASRAYRYASTSSGQTASIASLIHAPAEEPKAVARPTPPVPSPRPDDPSARPQMLAQLERAATRRTPELGGPKISASGRTPKLTAHLVSSPPQTARSERLAALLPDVASGKESRLDTMDDTGARSSIATGPVTERVSRSSEDLTGSETAAKDYYVEAGLFARKPLAERLAKILTEIAPATVEPVTIGARAVHRVRLGPFAHSKAAQDAVERIRGAGLVGARLEKQADE